MTPYLGKTYPLPDGVVPDGDPIWDLTGGVTRRHGLPRLAVGVEGPRVTVIAWNSSSARKDVNDWTNHRVTLRALDLGWARWDTQNLCGATATRPKELRALDKAGANVVGDLNYDCIRASLDTSDFAVAAWGDGGVKWADPVIAILCGCHRKGMKVFHWGDLTDRGQPRHPSRWRNDARLNPYFP